MGRRSPEGIGLGGAYETSSLHLSPPETWALLGSKPCGRLATVRHLRHAQEDRKRRSMFDELLRYSKLIDLGRPLFQGMPQSPNHPQFRMVLERRHGDRYRPDRKSTRLNSSH